MLSRTDDLALLIGRVFVAALFLPHGFHKLMNFWSFAASLGAKGVPYSNAPMKAVGEKERRHAPSSGMAPCKFIHKVLKGATSMFGIIRLTIEP